MTGDIKSSPVFGEDYSGSYDTIYQDKNYKAECDIIEKFIRSYLRSGGKDVLDIGCGTGGHAIELASRGYKVTGIDISRPMLHVAQGKSDAVDFIQMDARTLSLKKKYDVIIMMFAVLGYTEYNDEICEIFKNIKAHLKPGGILIADVWYGPAVLIQKPSERIKITEKDEKRIIRVSKGTLDTERNLCHVSFDVWETEGDKILSYVKEHHYMRYFFIPELEMFLHSNGFIIKTIRGFPDINIFPPDETTWNICFVAQNPAV